MYVSSSTLYGLKDMSHYIKFSDLNETSLVKDYFLKMDIYSFIFCLYLQYNCFEETVETATLVSRYAYCSIQMKISLETELRSKIHLSGGFITAHKCSINLFLEHYIKTKTPLCSYAATLRFRVEQ